MKMLHYAAFGLLVIGGLNWLLVGVIGQDVGQLVFGSQEAPISRVIYVLVGLAAIAAVLMHKGDCKICAGGGNMPMAAKPQGTA